MTDLVITLVLNREISVPEVAEVMQNSATTQEALNVEIQESGIEDDSILSFIIPFK